MAASRAVLKKREAALVDLMTADDPTAGQLLLSQLYLEYADARTDPGVRQELYYFVFAHFGAATPSDLDTVERTHMMEVFEEYQKLVDSQWSTINHKQWIHCLVWGLYGNQHTRPRVDKTLHRLLFAKLEADYFPAEPKRRSGGKRYRDGMVYSQDGTARKKRVSRCSLCGKTDHNKRRCPGEHTPRVELPVDALTSGPGEAAVPPATAAAGPGPGVGAGTGAGAGGGVPDPIQASSAAAAAAAAAASGAGLPQRTTTHPPSQGSGQLPVVTNDVDMRASHAVGLVHAAAAPGELHSGVPPSAPPAPTASGSEASGLTAGHTSSQADVALPMATAATPSAPSTAVAHALPPHSVGSDVDGAPDHML